MKKDFECPASDMSCPYFMLGYCMMGEIARQECDEAWVEEEEEE